jgi:hypothetical protein
LDLNESKFIKLFQVDCPIKAGLNQAEALSRKKESFLERAMKLIENDFINKLMMEDRSSSAG